MDFNYSRHSSVLNWMIYAALMSLALGLLTSISLLALSHIFIAIPALVFLPRTNFKSLEKSTWALLAMIIVIAVSVVVNQDIAIKGYAPLSKVKYFIFGFVMIAPFSFYFKNVLDQKKLKWLLYAFCLASTTASVVGMVSMYFKYNFITMRDVSVHRNAGFFGMLMNYAHNMAFFEIIVIGLIFYRRKLEFILNKYFLYAVFLINFIGLYMTFTRGALLALMIATPFYFFKKHKKWFVGVLVSVVALGGIIYFAAGKSILRPDSDNQRLSMWITAMKAFEERPIMGFGYLNFESQSLALKKRYDLPEKKYGGHAHNNFFEMLASTGFIGFSTFLLWLGFWFWEMYKRDDIVAKITLPFIVTFVVGGLTQSTISLGVNLFFIMSGYAISQWKTESLPPKV